MLDNDPPGGTCPSLPILLVAIGRRLGHPLHVVHAPGHVFARWDDSSVNGECWNFEFHGKGLATYPDEHYHQWPVKWTDWLLAEEKKRGPNALYLLNKTPAQLLASFLALRGHVLEASGKIDQAIDAYRSASRFDPVHPAYQQYALKAAQIKQQNKRVAQVTDAVATAEFIRKNGALAYAQSLTPIVPDPNQHLQPAQPGPLWKHESDPRYSGRKNAEPSGGLNWANGGKPF